jgi:hypothetical protein
MTNVFLMLFTDDECIESNLIDSLTFNSTQTLEEYFVNGCMKHEFYILQLNIRSYRRNFDEFLVFLSSFNKFKINCIVLTETWLDDDEVVTQLPGYNVFRTTNKLNQNDGVLVYIDNSLAVASCDQLCLGGVATCLAMTFNLNGVPCHLLSAYRSPNTNLSSFVVALQSYFVSINDMKHLQIFCGDININILNVLPNSMQECYLDMMHELGFISLINRVTRPAGNSCIDHFFLKNDKNIQIKSAIIESSITDHYPTFIQLNWGAPGQCGSSQRGRPPTYKVTDWHSVGAALLSTDWGCVTGVRDDVDHSTDTFINIIQSTIERYSQTKLVTAKTRKIKPWITQGLVNSIRFRDRLSKRVVRQPFNAELRHEYRTYRNILHLTIRNAKTNYYKEKITNAGRNPKKFWSVVNELACRPGVAGGFPLAQFYRDGVPSESDIKKIGNSFNSLFSNIGAQLASAIPERDPELINDAHYTVNEPFVLQPVTQHDILKIVRDARGGSAPGLDGIHTKFIKEHINAVIEPLLFIINESIRTGKFPNAFKIAKVIPIFKSGSKSDINNFRPISMLSVFAKILEKLVKLQLQSHLEINKIIVSNQYGFRSNKNTSNALFDITNEIVQKVGEGNHVLITFLDLAKAFDSVDRSKLLKKLECCGVRGLSLEWFQSYLHERKQSVCINNVCSDVEGIDYGVIQGSTLGPLLFLVYINNISKVPLDGKLFLFADDTAVVSFGVTWEDAFRQATKDLFSIRMWLDQNKLTLNVEKTKYLPIYFRVNSVPEQEILRLHSCNNYLSVTCNCEVLRRVEQYGYLGVLIDHRLSWAPHVAFLKQRVRKLIYAFRQLREVLPVYQLRVAYFAYIQSVFLYGILAWGGASSAALEPVAVAQRAIIKTCLKRDYRYPTDLIYQEFQVFSIRQLYIKVLLTFIYYNKTLLFNNPVHEHNTRYINNVGILQPRLLHNCSRYNSKYICHIIYRNIPNYLKQMENFSISTYKFHLNRWLFEIGRDAAELLIQSAYRH